MKNKALELPQIITKIITLRFVLFVFLLAYCPSSWAQVVFVNVPEQPSPMEWQIESVCQFYGLNIVPLAVPNEEEGFVAVDTFKQYDDLAIIIHARALSHIDMEDILSVVGNELAKKILPSSE